MQITFAIRGLDGTTLDEAQAHASLDAGILPTEEMYLYGWLRWRRPDQPDLDFNDDLSMLFPACLSSVAALRRDGRAELAMASYYCHLTLIAEEDAVRVLREDDAINGAEVAGYPKDEFLQALSGCCRRFADYAKALAVIDPRWTGLRDMMSRSSG
jgi:hypothetical protein